MAIDMKQVIADSVGRLLADKKVRKLTVKEIVEECNISRQTFYYHFDGIPDLIKWKLETEFDKLLWQCLAEEDLESGMNDMFSIFINVQPLLKTGLKTNYGEDLEKLLNEFTQRFFRSLIMEKGMYGSCSASEKELIIRFHCKTIMGILREWTEEDTLRVKEIVHLLYALMMGEIQPL